MALQQRYPNGFPWMVGSAFPIVAIAVIREVWTPSAVEAGETNDKRTESWQGTIDHAVKVLKECDALSQDPIVNGWCYATGTTEDPFTADNHAVSVSIRRLDGGLLKPHQLIRLFKLAGIIASTSAASGKGS